MPTIDKTSNRSIEGFGISYIEASFFSVPSIASNIGGTAEAIIDNETGIILKDLSSLEKEIIYLLDNKDKRKLGPRCACLCGKRRWFLFR